MSEEKEKSTEEQVEKITAIVGSDALGYQGSGREEHSGENAPDDTSSLGDELADNRPKDL
jgi:hypothetical protein